MPMIKGEILGLCLSDNLFDATKLQKKNYFSKNVVIKKI